MSKNVDFKFLRCNLSHNYNYEMNDNDVADQLRLIYRIQRLQRNFKWWWALWLWGLEISLVNAYMMMRRYCEMNGIKVPYSHHDFREAIAHALLDPSEWTTRNRKSPPESSQKKRRAAAGSQQSPNRTLRLNDVSLCPNSGCLRHRLDSSLNHWPTLPGGKDAVCQLHHWAGTMKANKAGKATKGPPLGSRKHVVRCDVCSVNLCVPCWKIFHSCKEFSSQIDSILSSV